MNRWILFSIYLLYRFVRLVFHSFQEQILWRFTHIRSHLAKINQDPAFSGLDCQILSIIFKKKLVEDGDITSSNDFILWHEKFASAKDVLAPDPHWSLYMIDKNYVYFVLLPNPWPYYNAKRAPFLFLVQYEQAKKVARMSHMAFQRFSETSLHDPKGPVVFYTNASRTGSTLLTRVMQVSEERITCFSEPDGFTYFSMLIQRGLIPENSALDLLKAIFKFYCKTQGPGQTYFIKPPSNCTRLVPLVKKAMPRVKHMFTFRHNTRRVISSVERMVRSVNSADLIAALWNIAPWLACHLVSMGAFEYELCTQFGVKDCLDFAIIMHVSPWYFYNKYEDYFDIPVIFYEDLVREKEETLRSVFQICELPYDQLIGEAMKEFGIDSQGGTMLSQGSLMSIADTPLDEERVKRMITMCKELGIPPIQI